MSRVVEKIQDAFDQGADLKWIRRCFHLSKSDLQEFCADIKGDFDDPVRGSVTGY